MTIGLKRIIWEWRGVWITAPSIALAVIVLRLTGILQFWEWGAYDSYMRYRPQLDRDNRVVIVGIDEADLHYLGRATISDDIYAQLLQKLKAMQPRAIGLDIYRDLPVPPGNKALEEVFQTTPNLIGIEKVVGDSRRDAVAAPPTLKAKGQVGANDLVIDADNRVRRGLLYLKDKEGNDRFSFGLYLALLYLQAEGISPQPIEGTQNWWLGAQVFSPLEANDGGYVRTDAKGFQVLLNYRGARDHFDTVSLRDVLEGNVPQNWGRDRIILIGKVGESFNDLLLTPYSSDWFTTPEAMTGVEIQAHLISQIISATKGERLLLKTWPEAEEGLWILIWSGIGAFIAWHWRYADGNLIIFGQGFRLFLVSIILLVSTYVAFVLGWWIPIVPPFLALAGSTVTITVSVARTAGFIRKIFGRYLTDEVVATLLENKEGLKLGGSRQMVTMLTSDIRGFTALSEQLPPEEVVQILNIYLAHMVKVIKLYNGTIDKVMGDGIFATFGAPTVRDDDAQRAVACAVAMQLEMTAVNQEMKALGLPFLQMGIGMNTGEVVVGNIGSEEHAEYTAIGNHVNLAFRIETYTTGRQILISDATKAAVGMVELRIDGEKQVKPKGVQQPITLYEVGGIGSPYDLFIPKEEEVFLPLKQEIPILYFVVQDKQVSHTIFKGSLVKLSTKGAEIRAERSGVNSVPPPLSNIKLNLLRMNDCAKISEDIYAMVLEKPTSERQFYIYFTFKPPSVETELSRAIAQSYRYN